MYRLESNNAAFHLIDPECKHELHLKAYDWFPSDFAHMIYQVSNSYEQLNSGVATSLTPSKGQVRKVLTIVPDLYYPP